MNRRCIRASEERTLYRNAVTYEDAAVLPWHCHGFLKLWLS